MTSERRSKLTKVQQAKIIAAYGKDSPLVREMRGLPPLREPVVLPRKPKGKP